MNINPILLYIGICINFAEFVIGVYYSIHKVDSCNTIIPYNIWIILKSIFIILFCIDRIVKYKIYISILLWFIWFVWLIFGMVIFWGNCFKYIPIVAQFFTYLSFVYNFIIMLYILKVDRKAEYIKAELETQLIKLNNI